MVPSMEPGRRGTMAALLMTATMMTVVVTTAQETLLTSPDLRLTSLMAEEGSALDTLQDLDVYMDSLADFARLYISKAFTEEARRYRRALDIASVKVTGSEVEKFELEEAPGDTVSWTKHVTGVHRLTHQGYCYWILGAPRLEDQRVVAWSPVTRSLKTIAKFQLTFTSLAMVDKIAARVHSGFLVLALGSSESRFVSIVCINLLTGQLQMPQVIPSRGVVGDLHLFEALAKLYLVVGESYYTTPGDGAAHSAMYVMVGDYFDYLDGLQFKASGVRDITGFADRGNYYLIFGMKSVEGSCLYEFNMAHETLTLVQQVSETDVLGVLHYTDSHDHKHYVIFVSTNAPQIYWWSSNQLRKWQVLQHPAAAGVVSSVEVLALPNLENIIFISSGATITLYGDDLTGHYSESFSVHTACLAVHDLRAVALGSSYYLFYVCVGAVNRLEARVIYLQDVVLGEGHTEGDPLLRCLTELTRMMDERKADIAYLEDVVAKDSLMTVDHPQVWRGPVTVPEVSVTGKTTAAHTTVVSYSTTAMTTNQTMEEYRTAVAKLRSDVDVVNGQLSTVMFHSGSQTITGPITATSLTVDNLHMDGLLLKMVNGVALNRIGQEFLVDGVDQTIEGLWHADHLFVDTFSTRITSPPGSISGSLTTDYMRRGRRGQVVTGRHTYTRLLAAHVYHRLCHNFSININGVETATIVTRGANVTFLGKKIFGNLTIDETLDANSINSVMVKDMASRVVYKGVPALQLLVGNYTIGSVLVKGNVAAASINGINVVELDNNVVKKHGSYKLAGGLVYKKDVVVSGSVQADSINGELWTNLVDRNSTDLITGTYHFSDVTITGSLDSNNINGLDLSTTVVLIDATQTIYGRIVLEESVSVSGAEGVVLEAGATINTIRPSSLHPPTLNGTLVIDQDISFLSPLLVGGDVKADSVNGLVLESLATRYWRKSANHTFNTSVYIQNVVFAGPVLGETVNGLPLTDYLHKSTPETVYGNYTFQGKVVVKGNILLEAGNTMDNVDVSELLDKVVTLNTPQTITGHKSFLGKVNIAGDLNLQGRLNGLDVATDLLRLDQNLPQTGSLTFTNRIEMTTLDVVRSDVVVESVNGQEVARAAADLVLLGESATIAGADGLRFTGDVHVHTLVAGMVDGIDLENMVKTAVKKSSQTPQHITSRVTVEKDVIFKELSVVRVNGEDWTDYLNNVVSVNYSGEIVGRKVFTKPLYVKANFNPKVVNGINLNVLAARILRRAGEQVINGTYTFNASITARELFAQVIDGVNMDTIMLVDEGRDVAGLVTFAEEVAFFGLTSDTDVLDGCDLGKLQSGAMWKDGSDLKIDSEVMIDTLVIEGEAIASEVSAVKAGNKVDVVHFLDTLVLKSSDQVITGMVQFLNDIHIGHLQVDTINDVQISELIRLAVMTSEDVVITCDLSFTKGVTVKTLEVKTVMGGDGGVLVNGVNISDVASRAVLTTGGPVMVTGKKLFTKGLAVDQLVAVSVSGVAVKDLVVMARTDAMAKDLTFTAPISVLGDLMVSGLVDGQDLTRLFSSRVVLNASQTLFASYTFDTLIVEGDLQVDTINGVRISELVLKFGRQHQVVSGSKLLRGGLHVDGVIILSTINGLDIWQLNNTVARLDHNITINAPVTFENKVTCSVKVFVKETVNNFDLSELSRNVSSIKEKITDQYHRIDNLLGQFGSINKENYKNAEGLYAELSYLERLDLPGDTDVYGTLWVGNIPAEGPGQYLKIISCPQPPCGCDSECFYYKVKNNTRLELVTKLGIRIDIVNDPLNNERLVAIYSKCENGLPKAAVDVDYYVGKLSIATYKVMGMVLDTGLFTSKGTTYLVILLSYVEGTHATEKWITVVLKLDAVAKQITTVWKRESPLRAVSLDLAFTDASWFLLVVNDYDPDNHITPYTVASQLFVWNHSSEMFTLKGEYVADHATSGRFLTAATPVETSFFTISQLKEADSAKFTDCAKYTAKLLIFRYNKKTRNFEGFQSLAVYGVVDQAVMSVDDNLYLLLVSTVNNALYVCQYFHSEGFTLLYKISVEKPYSVLVVKMEDQKFVVVSTMHGLVRLKVHIKGVNPDLLLLE
ncbi:uncharacterized protein [Procambarus clarkii]|uniref:uncharacterized protein n=1 Tax=Procambarus clarkii TaxID=6728 RepID=UPI003743DD2A